jgi:hypothetical protein
LYNNVQGEQLFDREEEIGKARRRGQGEGRLSATQIARRIPFFQKKFAFLKNPFYI